MGLDLTIEDHPRFVVTGSVTNCYGDTEAFGGEVNPEYLRSLFEDTPQSADLRINTEPRMPELPADAVCDLYISYPGFGIFRRKVAATIGIDLDQMKGWGGDRPWSGVESGMAPLLMHSDYDGYLSAEECRAIAPALAEAIPKMTFCPPNDIDGFIRDWSAKFLSMIRTCGECNRRIVFH